MRAHGDRKSTVAGNAARGAADAYRSALHMSRDYRIQHSYCAPSVSKSGSISNARGIWQKKYQHAFVTFQVPPAPESAAEPTGGPRLPNAPPKANRTQCYSGCTYCTCFFQRSIQARVDKCLKAMNKSRQGEVDRLVGIDTVMEPEAL